MNQMLKICMLHFDVHAVRTHDLKQDHSDR